MVIVLVLTRRMTRKQEEMVRKRRGYWEVMKLTLLTHHAQ